MIKYMYTLPPFKRLDYNTSAILNTHIPPTITDSDVWLKFHTPGLVSYSQDNVYD